MNAIYKFELTINGVTSQCYPIYKDSLEKEYSKESGQEFFRARLTGSLTFEAADYDSIVNAAFDTRFGLEIFMSSDAGATWTSYWKGKFYKTDCTFNGDAKTVEVKPEVDDAYAKVLDGMEHEFDLIKLAPVIREVDADKRPLIQVYVPGDSVIGCFMGGMWWEQECTPESDTDILTESGDGKPNFERTYYKYLVELDNVPEGCPKVFMTNEPIYINNVRTIVKDGWTLQTGYAAISPNPGQPTFLTRNSDGAQWQGEIPSGLLPITLTLHPVSGTPAIGNIELYAHRLDVLSRILCDVDEINAQPTYQIASDDMVPDNRNYRRVVKFVSNSIVISEEFSTTPTRWGLYEPGIYYAEPPALGSPEFFPIARSTWGDFSLWFTYSSWITAERNFEIAASKEFTLRHAYPLASVLSVLLNEMGTGLTFGETAQYSEFLYDIDNSVRNYNYQILITPKSNVISSSYDTPAQKAPITLKDVLDMLRSCYRLYWFIDGSKFRLEHISYFMRGGSYSAIPEIGVNLTTMILRRNGKSWDFGQGKFEFNKMATEGRYQFGWMDEVTEFFNGFPIDINSGFVNKESVNEVIVTNFTSDIDYILLNPSQINEDGFVLLAPVLYDGRLKLPYVNYAVDGNPHWLQNGFAAFCMLAEYYLYDMPAPDCEMNGEPLTVFGTKRLRTSKVKFPCPTDPNLQKLVQTSLGSGQIEKLSINLCSRIGTAELLYDTE